MRSVIANVFLMLISPPKNPGPRNALRPTEPVKSVLVSKSEALKHGEVTQFPTSEKFLRVKAAVGCNRIVEPERLFPASAPASPPSIMLNGKPVRQKNVPEICHPPIAAFTRRFSLLN